MNNKKEALIRIIKNEQLKIVFQPVISLKNGDILGYEALSRITTETIFENIEELFFAAIEHELIWDLEYLSRSKTLDAAREFMIPPLNKKLFMNVNPIVIDNEEFTKELDDFFTNEYQISPHNMAFDVTEKYDIEGVGGFKSSISQYKNQRNMFSLDQSDIENASLDTTYEVEPDFIKLDMKLIRDIHQDSLKSAIVKGMVEYSKVGNISLIAEGVETSEEFRTVMELGVQYVQGYYIQKPNEKILPIRTEIMNEINLANQIKIKKSKNEIYYTPIKQLISSIKVIPPSTLVLDAYELLSDEANSMGLVIVDEETPLGLITKENLAFALSGRYGFTLYQDKPISKIMNRQFLSVDANMPVNIVADIAMSRSTDSLYDFIVVTEQDKYIGIVTIKNILQKATELKITSAQQQSPLTGLPGNMLVAQKMQHFIENDSSYSISYLDLDNFKAFNDIYGFESGNMIIKLLGNVLKKCMPSDAFIGHIGGDDFVVFFEEIIDNNYFEKMIHLFEQKALSYYTIKDRESGYITTKSRTGELVNYPLISVTAVTVTSKEKNI